MAIEPHGFDLSEAVNYHYDRFPPGELDLHSILKPVTAATAALARYDQMLKGMHNSEILLAPLRSQEAVVSSRMEGTISTLDEVLQYEADKEDDDGPISEHYRSEAIEVALYARAMRAAQAAMQDGQPISSWLLRAMHRDLLSVGRGSTMSPGLYKTDQNYIADRAKKKILFIPISPERLSEGMEKLIEFVNDEEYEIMIKSAIAHLEFEALHPFKDGNGRIGRILIPLLLWRFGILSQPYFYVSSYFENHRDEYIDKMRLVSSSNEWSGWIVFFMGALEAQANANLVKAEEIRGLYEDMKERFRHELSSQWSTTAVDFVFTRPIFRNNVFTGKSGIPSATAHRFVRILAEKELLSIIRSASGRRPAMYSFEPILKLIRA